MLHHTGWAGHGDHFDLVLQFAAGIDDNDLVLKTFATLDNIFPNGEGKDRTLLVHRPDHRRLYLDYEGPVLGGRGEVNRIDSGGLIWKSDYRLWRGNDITL